MSQTADDSESDDQSEDSDEQRLAAGILLSLSDLAPGSSSTGGSARNGQGTRTAPPPNLPRVPADTAG